MISDSESQIKSCSPPIWTMPEDFQYVLDGPRELMFTRENHADNTPILASINLHGCGDHRSDCVQKFKSLYYSILAVILTV